MHDDASGDSISIVGAVIIGRNEGNRLRRCLQSVPDARMPIVYVDSGSTDGSAATARRFGADVIELDTAAAFSAARARNAGYQRLAETHPEVRFVQFIDGDCELLAEWPARGLAVLRARDDLAVVAGLLHERCPGLSIYNRLGELEWNFDGPGEVEAVGGIFMIRREAFESAGGFDPTVAAGEEPELCQRLRRHGWRLLRLDCGMATHDLATVRFSQWCRRQTRNGYGAIDVANRFGLDKFRHMTNKARFWSVWPLAVIAIGVAADCTLPPVSAGVVTLLALGVWPAQMGRIALRTWRAGAPLHIAAAYGFFTMISYWPQMGGQLLYWRSCLITRRPRVSAREVSTGTGSGSAGWR